MILEEYQSALPELERLLEEVLTKLREALVRNEMLVTTVEGRVKTQKSLEGKLALKGGKYATLSDVTDLVGARIVTFYTDDVDRIAAMVEQLFEVDWNNSVDKRMLHQLDTFGYNSLHYVCTLPGYTYRFELQLRITLQHAWASINHDIGYKTGVEIPHDYLRRINRLVSASHHRYHLPSIHMPVAHFAIMHAAIGKAIFFRQPELPTPLPCREDHRLCFVNVIRCLDELCLAFELDAFDLVKFIDFRAEVLSLLHDGRRQFTAADIFYAGIIFDFSGGCNLPADQSIFENQSFQLETRGVETGSQARNPRADDHEVFINLRLAHKNNPYTP